MALMTSMRAAWIAGNTLARTAAPTVMDRLVTTTMVVMAKPTCTPSTPTAMPVAEMTAYMESGEHWDKAGAYAVQDTRFNPAKEVLGCYLNAMGFPLCEVAGLLAEMGVQTRLRPGYRLPDQCRDCSLRKPPEGLER